MEQSADLEASVALRAQSKDWAALLRLISRHGTRVLAEGHEKALRRWVAIFPAQLAADVPWITYWSGAATIAASPVAARLLLSGKAKAVMMRKPKNLPQMGCTRTSMCPRF